LDEFMGEQLFALERGYALVHNVCEQLLAARLPFRVVRMCDLSHLVLVQECPLLTVHAQRGDLGELDFGPALRAHERFGHLELLAKLGEHTAVLGARVVP
jgi:hypothetical protein